MTVLVERMSTIAMESSTRIVSPEKPTTMAKWWSKPLAYGTRNATRSQRIRTRPKCCNCARRWGTKRTQRSTSASSRRLRISVGPSPWNQFWTVPTQNCRWTRSLESSWNQANQWPSWSTGTVLTRITATDWRSVVKARETDTIYFTFLFNYLIEYLYISLTYSFIWIRVLLWNHIFYLDIAFATVTIFLPRSTAKATSLTTLYPFLATSTK